MKTKLSTLNNLSNLTKLELLDLRYRVNEELKEVENRSKIKIYKIFKEFDGTKYFYQKPNALKYLNEMISYEEIFDDNDSRIELNISYLSTTDAAKWCEDSLI